MQVLPLLTPNNYNLRKRPRSSEDYETHYLKKRLISCLTPFNPIPDEPKGSLPTPPHEYHSPPLNAKHDVQMDDEFILDEEEEEQQEEDCPKNETNHSRINIMDINGSLLPMEQRSGESKYRIPSFVLNHHHHHQQQQQQQSSYSDLLLTALLYNEKAKITEIIAEEDNKGDPMDLD
ncbi:hypothetical protein CU097_005704 [Rhizopus azygosporus]|uniref:Uncharacterized protein n=1 Tax=Rhizopus azygosporus TaxID=86630 RepID=A0A367IZQ5_RHIAZ|nr:hypothetical protein CU097_005704 [Rhizopus azygosporus]